MADGGKPGEHTLQPHNIEAEQAVLGALLLNNDVYDRIGAILKAEDFFDPVHQRIYEAAKTRIDRQSLASPVSLKPVLADDRGLAELGGTDYLVRLAEATVSIAAAADYAKQVRDFALRRELISLGDGIRDRAARFDPNMDAPDQIIQAEQELYQLGETGRTDKGFVNFKNALNDAIRLANAAYKRDGKLAGISTGLHELDYTLGGLRNSDLVIIAGRPSMGKTALATNIAFNIARAHRAGPREDGTHGTVNGGHVGFFSLEMSADQLANRILAAEAQVKGHEVLAGKLKREQFDALLRVSTELESLPLYIDATPALSIATIASRARRLKRDHDRGLDVLIIDYLQLVRPASGRDHGRVQEISEITQGLKAIAKELDIPVIALSQLSRQVENRDDKRPQLSDLRESGSIEQDSDAVMFVFREEYYHERLKPREDDPTFPDWQQKAERLHGGAEVIIGKQRHGPIGTVKLHFDAKFTKFSDPVRPSSGYLEDGTDFA